MSRKDNYKATAKKNKKQKTYNEQRADAILEQKDKKTKAYKNPASTLAGKIIIVILALFMAFGGLFSLIWAIIQNR